MFQKPAKHGSVAVQKLQNTLHRGGAEHPGIHQLVDLTVIIDINFRYRL